MSLHALANHLQEAGRGQDKVLVHMTPKEVSGLQSLAMAHGGSLTINPETGLPEAGFLSSILPMIAGFALNAFLPGVGTAIGSALGGLSGAAGTGILVGGVTGLAKGSLKDGIMAGLGAYGGAGMAEGLASAGASNLPATASGQTATNLGQQTFNAVGAPVELSAPIGSTAAETTAKAAVESGGLGGIQPFANSNVMAANPYGLPAPNLPQYLGSTSPLPIAGEAMPSLDITGAGIPTAPTTPIINASNFPANAYNGPVNDIDAIMSQGTPPSAMDKLGAGFDRATSSWEGAKEVWNATPKGTGLGLAATGMSVMQSQQEEEAAAARAAADAAAAERRGYMRPYEYSTALTENAFAPRESTSEMRYFTEPRFTAGSVYKVKDGGLMSLPNYAVGGPVEQMSANNSIGGNTMYPQSQLQTPMYSNPMVQRPMPTDVISSGIDAPTNRYTGEMRMAGGGITNLGGYSDGGRLLRGPGDGVSDSIPAQIGDKQPARLADGEFVVPARIVSEIGNGSTEAGARKLYAMMNRVQHARKKTVGKNQVAKNTKAENLLPA